MAESEKYYVTITGPGQYGSRGGRLFSGGPHEIDADTAEEMLKLGLDWIQVSKGSPVARTDNVLRGAFTLADIEAAQQEASRKSGSAPAEPGDADASTTESDAEADGDRVSCDHCDKDYATQASLDRHVASQHPEFLNSSDSGDAQVNDNPEGDS